MKSYVLGFLLFLTSLYSLYIYNLSLVTIIGVMGFALFGFLTLYKKAQVKVTPILYLFFLYILIGSLGVLFNQEYDSARALTIIFFVFLIISLPSVFLSVDQEKFYGFVISLHCLLFYIQFFSYYLLGVHVDFLAAFALESRNVGGSFSLPWNTQLFRASGIFSEPGTYACFLAPLVAIFSSFIKNFKSKIIFYASLLSLVLSFSTFGFVFFTLISFLSIKRIKYKALILIIGFSFSFSYFYWRFFVRQSYGLDSGLGFRFEYITASIENILSLNGFFYGAGGLSINPFEFSAAGADNDSGLIFYILYNFGGLSFFATIIFLVWCFFNFERKLFLAVFIIFLSKISFYAFAFPIYLIGIYCANRIKMHKGEY